MGIYSFNRSYFFRMVVRITIFALIAFFPITTINVVSAYANSFRLPLDGSWTISQDFNVYNSTRNDYHLGEDVLRNSEVPVYAPANGIVKHNTNKSRYGYVIIIEHQLSDGSYVNSVLGHLRQEGRASVGTNVNKGDIVGYLSSDPNENGGYSFTHIHFGIRKGSYSTTWVYQGYGTASEVNNWHDPSDFVNSHQNDLIPISGDMNGDGIDSYGIFDPSGTTFTIDGKTVNFATPSDRPIIGDWDDDGKDEIGVFRPNDNGMSKLYLITRDWNTLGSNAGAADVTIPLGGLYPDNKPISGNWDGIGGDDYGGFSPNTFYLYTINLGSSTATRYRDIPFGINGDKPLSGDWDNDGDDDIGIFRPQYPNQNTNSFFLDTGLSGGQHELGPYEYGNTGDLPVIGDWNGDGVDNIGVYRPSTSQFFTDPNIPPPPTITYTISTSTFPAGLNPQPTGGGTYNSGQTVIVTAQPVSGYVFQRWTEGGSQVSPSASYQFIVTGNRNLVAEYAQNTGTLSVTTTPVSGSISVDGTYKGTGSWSGQISAGSHTVSFGVVSGYTTPSSQTVTVITGQTATVIGTYVPINTQPATVFGRDIDNGLWYKRYSGSSWGSWTSLGGIVTSNISSITQGSDTYVFVRGLDNGLWYGKLSGGTSWGGWQSLGGILTSDPESVVSGSDIYVFVRGSDNALYYKRLSYTSWTDWISLGGTLTSSPDASIMGSELHVFVRGLDNALWHKKFISGAFSSWTSLGGALSSDPEAAQNDVFVRGADNGISYKRLSGSAFSSWASLGGIIKSNPDALPNDVYAIGGDNAIWHNKWSGSSWSGWQSLGGIATSDPETVVSGSETYLFVRSSDNTLWYKKQTGGTWGSWTNLGGVLTSYLSAVPN